MEHQNIREAKIVDLGVFRQKKQIEETQTRGRASLTEGNGLKDDAEYVERVGRIKNSLDRINSLMDELKKMSSQQSNPQTKS